MIFQVAGFRQPRCIQLGIYPRRLQRTYVNDLGRLVKFKANKKLSYKKEQIDKKYVSELQEAALCEASENFLAKKRLGK